MTLDRIEQDTGGPRQWIDIDFPADSVGLLEPLTDHSSAVRVLTTIGVILDR